MIVVDTLRRILGPHHRAAPPITPEPVKRRTDDEVRSLKRRLALLDGEADLSRRMPK